MDNRRLGRQHGPWTGDETLNQLAVKRPGCYNRHIP
ncbi:hypothetical protein CLOBOL_00030 [Enterocloster bolteae ATCC BAA-613]|uniref:Uncharacterized protein n=1 Tax=Enterocloster bolteae (strain ATCC BAA-613 / DSM 15670 / CCUG 46953 / JCM 12243 / WAL 16351) TaxID=411902 RepID=A8RG30_ENTBW|nr:hypothetical protein CLOBOL_00030 [Enterocloster bolteae ATCC BAA-613]